MPTFERAGGIPVGQLFGGWQQSRAVNPSSGDDPISLGLFSGALAPAPAGTTPDPAPVSEVPPFPPPGPVAEIPPSALPPFIPVSSASANVVELDTGLVHLNGRQFTLSPPAVETVLGVILDSYAMFLTREVDELRRKLLPLREQEVRALRAADLTAALVRHLQIPAAPLEPAEEGPPPSEDVQPVPEAPRPSRRVRKLSRQGAGNAAPEPTT